MRQKEKSVETNLKTEVVHIAILANLGQTFFQVSCNRLIRDLVNLLLVTVKKVNVVFSDPTLTTVSRQTQKRRGLQV